MRWDGMGYIIIIVSSVWKFFASWYIILYHSIAFYILNLCVQRGETDGTDRERVSVQHPQVGYPLDMTFTLCELENLPCSMGKNRPTKWTMASMANKLPEGIPLFSLLIWIMRWQFYEHGQHGCLCCRRNGSFMIPEYPQLAGQIPGDSIINSHPTMSFWPFWLHIKISSIPGVQPQFCLHL